MSKLWMSAGAFMVAAMMSINVTGGVSPASSLVSIGAPAHAQWWSLSPGERERADREAWERAHRGQRWDHDAWWRWDRERERRLAEAERMDRERWEREHREQRWDRARWLHEHQDHDDFRNAWDKR